MTFDNLNDLFRYIENQTHDTMKNEVADTAKSALSEAVQTGVYDVYEPLYYVRRGTDGGLSDKSNYTVHETQSGIEITNDTPLDNGGTTPRLDEIICKGLGNQPFPRNFYKGTDDILESSDDVKEALKQGLNNRGINAD